MKVEAFLLALRGMAGNRRQEEEIDSLLREVREVERERADARLERRALRRELRRAERERERAYADGFEDGEASGFGEAVRIMEANGWITEGAER